jgi:hypothetical protein
MAARRLLIVMLVLLGISTLAAALVPQRTLNEGDTTGTTTTTQTSPTTTSDTAPETVPPVAEITVGERTKKGRTKFPVVPVHVGDQFTLLVLSRHPEEISIPEFGLFGFATANTPARFELLPTVPGRVGVLFAETGQAAAKIEVTEPSSKKPEKKGRKKGAKSRARGESGRS